MARGWPDRDLITPAFAEPSSPLLTREGMVDENIFYATFPFAEVITVKQTGKWFNSFI